MKIYSIGGFGLSLLMLIPGLPTISHSSDGEFLPVQVSFSPQNLNLASRGNWITARIIFPSGYSFARIAKNSIRLLDSLPEDKRISEGRVLVVKFLRQAAIDLMKRTADCQRLPNQAFLSVSGELLDGTVFRGTGSLNIHNLNKCTDLDGDCFSVEGGACGEVDCNDGDAGVYPGAAEICHNDIDNNCNGSIDEGCPLDVDMDGFYEDVDCNDRDPLVHPFAEEICDTIDNNCNMVIDEDFDGDGYSPCQNDCNENEPVINPAATEICDGIDNNCNGLIDDGTGFIDADDDGYAACGSDCDDTNPEVYPTRREVCDGIDNNCNGQVDEDFDGDGFTSCGGDCNDNIPMIYPGSPEVCDRLDNNCNGAIDEGFDLDGDGFTSCYGDCNDQNADVNPLASDVCGDSIDNDCDGRIDEDGEPEVCDGIDNNCDGIIDEGFDADGDGYTTCQNDCADGNAAIHPGVQEICDDGIDNDCNGKIDCYVDLDKDGYDTSVDFNDTNPEAYPGAPEIACDNIDQNGDGKDSCRFMNQGNGTVLDTTTGLLWLRDASCINDGNYYQIEDMINNLKDGQCGLTDGSWPGDWRIPTWDEMNSLSSGGYAGYLTDAAGDWLWTQGNAFWNIKSGVRNAYWTFGADASGNVNQMLIVKLTASGYTFHTFHPIPQVESATSNGTGYTGAWPVRIPFEDKDEDGYIEAHDDCNDTNANINPSIPEVCDTIDNNCDGRVDEICDYDGDGLTPQNGDCNDHNPSVNPNVYEIANNGLDDNCNGCLDCRFEDMRDGTVYDTKTGLVWMKDTTAIPSTDHASAKWITHNLHDGQYGLSDGSKPGDWRLPSVFELMTLVDKRFSNPALSNAKGDGKWSEGDAFLHVKDSLCECLDEKPFFGGDIYYWASDYADWKCCDCGHFPSRESCGWRDVAYIPLFGPITINESGPSYRVVDLKKGYSGTEICNFWFLGCWDWGWLDNAVCGYNKVKVWPVRNK